MASDLEKIADGLRALASDSGGVASAVHGASGVVKRMSDAVQAHARTGLPVQRLVAETIGGGIVPPGAGVPGNAVDDLMDVFGREAHLDQAHEVVMGQPRGQGAPVVRLRQARADPWRA